MKSVEAKFQISFTDEQYKRAEAYVEDMKNHPQRVYWSRNTGKSDEELIYAHIAHNVLSGYYHSYSPSRARQIMSMDSAVN
ncbi:MAG: hypothetical protein AAFQ98_13095 [Bacteroidota bacterium]